ncbi:MAG: hypothetical protein H6Q92_1358 [Nitrospirae bacterium]|nr:hypothetical protein [Nitrospirota bacterium]
MAKRSGMYKSDKRKKELMRQKKQELKRQKRLSKGDAAPEESDALISETTEVTEVKEQ